MTRKFVPVGLALTAAMSFTPAARAQISPGLHVARAADAFDGVNGVGGNLALTLPALPVELFFAADYFLPACNGCALWGGSADVHVTLPRRTVRPYGTAGLVLRNTEASDTKVRTGGIGLGGGVNLATRVMGAFAEGRYEIMDGSGDQLVFRLGFRL